MRARQRRPLVEETLGVASLYADDDWIELDAGSGSRFAVDVTGFPRSEVEAQPLMVSFAVDDLASTVAALAARGVEFYPDADHAIFDVGPALVATFRPRRQLDATL